MSHVESPQHPYLLPLKSTVVIILGGGRGTRLSPLTEARSKPAVPMAGKYRIVDFPISNCINSNFHKIFVLTQYQSASLNRHINLAYKFDHFSRGFVEVMAAEQTEQSEAWFQGTADAVRQQLRHFERWHPKYYLILSGDQIYRMDYRHMLAHHIKHKADLTVSVLPVNRTDATGFGLLHIDKTGRIVDFYEKPKDPAVLDRYRIPPEAATDLNLDPNKDQYLASMGIYLYSRDEMMRQLESSKDTDFGKHLIPGAIKTQRVFSYVFDGYWEDVGTIRSYYDANLALCRKNPPFDLFNSETAVYTNIRNLPPSRVYGSTVEECLVAEGSNVDSSKLYESVIGCRSVIAQGVTMRRTVMIGADHYDNEDARAHLPKDAPPLGVGEGSFIEGAILDKNVRIGKNVRITAKYDSPDKDGGPGWAIRDGVVIVKKNAIIPDGTVI